MLRILNIFGYLFSISRSIKFSLLYNQKKITKKKHNTETEKKINNSSNDENNNE